MFAIDAIDCIYSKITGASCIVDVDHNCMTQRAISSL